MDGMIKTQTEDAVQITTHLLEELFGDHISYKIGFRLWNGQCWPDEGPHTATIVLKHPGSLRSMLLPGTELGLGEAYIYDDFDIEGDAVSVFSLAEALSKSATGLKLRLRLGRELVRLPSRDSHRASQRRPAELTGDLHSVERDRQAIAYHYDISNDFYALWLDRNLVYSCAYFKSPDDGLDAAQEQKLDYICRKLRLRPGDHLLDVGCGWGGLIIYAAKHYGAITTGITLSKPQAEYAAERIKETGLSDQCSVGVRDYREVDEMEKFDALVSVGMFEHVGSANLAVYFSQAFQLLRPGGVFLNHGIASRATDKPQRGPTFSDSYVFPDGELVPINLTLRAAEGVGFEARDMESLREHYALTLRHWVHRLETRKEQALKFVDEPTYRIWRLFMSGSVYGFTTGSLNLYQTLLVKPGEHGQSHLPLTRADWYQQT
jgi:cyclopropane-fatty-acyl-phospholipid synthase